MRCVVQLLAELAGARTGGRKRLKDGSVLHPAVVDAIAAANHRLRIVEGNDHPDLGYALNLLGVVLLDEGRWQEAAPLLTESMKLWSRLGEKHRLMILSIANWAHVLEAGGDYGQGRRYFQKALELNHQSAYPDQLREARILALSALLEFDEGAYSAAERQAEQSVKMQRGAPGGNIGTPDMASTLIELAEARVFEHNAAAAEPPLREALDIYQRKLRPGYPGIIIAETRLGEALIYEGRAGAAERILRDALRAVYAPPFRVPEWQVGEAESALGWCLTVLGQSSEAEDLLHRAQNKLAADPRRIFRKQAMDRLTDVTQDLHGGHAGT